ncbi:MAG TPA: RecX family transcriptional regulator [Gaiellaceae bacterium]
MLDGEPWRTLPAEVVLRAGLDVGVELDRARARRVRQELRRHEAMEQAARVLRRRDVSAAELDARLDRARIAPAVRSETIERLTDAGAVDDARFARARAQALADRGAGDLLVRHDLAGRGIAAPAIEEAIALLEPERVRAARVCGRRGSGAKTARYLARKGFSEEAIESSCAEGVA